MLSVACRAQDAGSWWKMGREAFGQGEWRQAAEHFAGGVRAWTPADGSETLAVLYSDLSASYQMMGDLDAALRAAEQGVKADPGRDQPYAARAMALHRKRRFALAVKDYDRAIRIRPTPGYYQSRASARVSMWQGERAIRDCDLAIKLGGENAIAFGTRGTANERLRRYAAALDDFRRAVELAEVPGEGRDADPLQGIAAGLPQFLSYRGIGYLLNGRPDKAREDVERAAVLHSDEPFVLRNRARVNDAAGLSAEALADLDRAIKVRPDLAEVYADRGWLLFRMKDSAAAFRDLDRAIELDPDFSLEARVHRAQALLSQGRAREALADLKRVLSLDPDFPEAAQARARAMERLGRRRGAMDRRPDR